MRPGPLCAIAALCAAAALPAPAPALTVTHEECAEGADFIRNAALSRDNGLSGEAFLERLEGDFAAIRAIAPALRWFARDADDEALLRRAASEVFAAPRDAERHRVEFLASCRETVAGNSAPRPGSPGPAASR
jgi:hypothetical protein